MNVKAFQKRIGDIFRREREKTGLSQEEFAATMKMHRTYYSAIERGEKNLTLRTLATVCSALRIRPSVALVDAEDTLAA